METCTFPGCGYQADFITKAHCKMVHGITREELYSKYGKKTNLYNKAANPATGKGHIW